MGVKYLTHHHEKIDARLPFTISKEKILNYKDEYAQIGTGVLKSIGIDGSVFLHSYASSEENIIDNAKIIAGRILGIVDKILIFFKKFNKTDNDIILHIVIDSKPPIPKNRKETTKQDAYTALSLEDKDNLHKEILKHIECRVEKGNEEVDFLANNGCAFRGKEEAKLSDIDPYASMSNDERTTLHENLLEEIKTCLNNRPRIRLLSNINEENRKEGEIKLFSLCKEINDKYDNDPLIKNVIVSSDSDVVAMMNFHFDKSLVIVSNINGKLYILNHNLILSALKMTDRELATYTLLHYVYFGSDYNTGLVSSPTESKQKIIYQSVKNKINDINVIGKSFVRKRKRNEEIKDCKDNFLTQFKSELIVEALCSILYYVSLGDEKYLTELSPLLYRKKKSKMYIPFIEF